MDRMLHSSSSTLVRTAPSPSAASSASSLLLWPEPWPAALGNACSPLASSLLTTLPASTAASTAINCNSSSSVRTERYTAQLPYVFDSAAAAAPSPTSVSSSAAASSAAAVALDHCDSVGASHLSTAVAAAAAGAVERSHSPINWLSLALSSTVGLNSTSDGGGSVSGVTGYNTAAAAATGGGATGYNTAAAAATGGGATGYNTTAAGTGGGGGGGSFMRGWCDSAPSPGGSGTSGATIGTGTISGLQTLTVSPMALDGLATADGSSNNNSCCTTDGPLMLSMLFTPRSHSIDSGHSSGTNSREASVFGSPSCLSSSGCSSSSSSSSSALSVATLTDSAAAPMTAAYTAQCAAASGTALVTPSQTLATVPATASAGRVTALGHDTDYRLTTDALASVGCGGGGGGISPAAAGAECSALLSTRVSLNCPPTSAPVSLNMVTYDRYSPSSYSPNSSATTGTASNSSSGAGCGGGYNSCLQLAGGSSGFASDLTSVACLSPSVMAAGGGCGVGGAAAAAAAAAGGGGVLMANGCSLGAEYRRCCYNCDNSAKQRLCAPSAARPLQSCSGSDTNCGSGGGSGAAAAWTSFTRCPQHPQLALTMLCNTCQLPLCYSCALHHAAHSLDPLTHSAAPPPAAAAADLLLADPSLSLCLSPCSAAAAVSSLNGGLMSLCTTSTTSSSSSSSACQRALHGRRCSVRQQAAALLAALNGAQQRAVSVGAVLRQRAARARLEAAAVCDQLREALTVSQQRLERKATVVCQLKLTRLQQQCERLEQLRQHVLQLLEETQLTDTAAAGGGAGGGGCGGTAAADMAGGCGDSAESDAQQLVRCVMADQQLRCWLSAAPLSPVEDAHLRYVATPATTTTATTITSSSSSSSTPVAAASGCGVAGGTVQSAAVQAAAGRIESSGCAEQSRLALGSGSGATLVVGRVWHALLVVCDHYGDERVAPAADAVEALVTAPNGAQLPVHVQQLSASCYRLSCVPQLAGEHRFLVTVNGAAVALSDQTAAGSPAPPAVGAAAGGAGSGVWSQQALVARPLAQLGPAPRLVIGGGGESGAPGRFCRPWGVAFSPPGLPLVTAPSSPPPAAAAAGAGVLCEQQQQQLLAVSDRSNHRVQVFAASDGRLLLTFGRLGQRCGELNRPAGLTFTNCTRRLVVADKDNHRVQVFTWDGRFVFKFGEKGSRAGMFNYPWDVACSSRDLIAVSDTRNHRVQLFSPDGLLLRKFSQEGADWKELDSPRGLAFHPDGRLFITDFNNHRIVALNTATGYMSFIGCEGCEPCRFLRPQGIAIDDDGRLYVSDCRNSRVQVLTSAGEFVLQLGGLGAGPGQFDQPQGVAVSAGSALLAVVCLENHRVQVF